MKLTVCGFFSGTQTVHTIVIKEVLDNFWNAKVNILHNGQFQQTISFTQTHLIKSLWSMLKFEDGERQQARKQQCLNHKSHKQYVSLHVNNIRSFLYIPWSPGTCISCCNGSPATFSAFPSTLLWTSSSALSISIRKILLWH